MLSVEKPSEAVLEDLDRIVSGNYFRGAGNTPADLMENFKSVRSTSPRIAGLIVGRYFQSVEGIATKTGVTPKELFVWHHKVSDNEYASADFS